MTPPAVLVTGAAGYLGHQLVAALAERRVAVGTVVATDVRAVAPGEQREGVVYAVHDVRADGLAERLEKMARDHGVEVYADPDLAGALSALDTGSLVPPDLYRAVAEVLAYCYRINERLKEKLAEQGN